MVDTKWHPQKGVLKEVENFIKTHEPICSAQDYWYLGTKGPETFFDKFLWKEKIDFFRKKKITREEAKEYYYEALKEIKIYPYEERRELLFEDAKKVKSKNALQVPLGRVEINFNELISVHPEMDIFKRMYLE